MPVSVRLPFDSFGKSVAVTQSPGGARSHAAELYNAWDFDLPAGTKVLAIAGGTVIDIRETVPDGAVKSSAGDKSLGSGGLGNLVTIKHVVGGVTFYSTYLHLAENSVPLAINQTVAEGQVIGLVGRTGVRDGDHLHVQVGTKAKMFGDSNNGWADKTDNGEPQWIADASKTSANTNLVSFQGYSTSLPSKVVGPTFTAASDSVTLAASSTSWSALAGNDTVTGSSGNDTVNGDGGNDKLYGQSGNDKLYGGADNDTLDGGGSDDLLDGGSGNDQLLGGSGNDILVGSSGNDGLDGGSGNDQLRGDAGVDKLAGGSGRDSLFGGDGSDHFVFTSTSDSGSTTSTADVIGDFTKGTDRIDLSAIDANTTSGGDQKFILDAKGSASSAVAKGHIGWYQVNNSGTANDFTYIRLNNDSDSSIESVIQLNGLITLTSADFIL
jgi:Ca2+-binding RTX toxin-like protein